MVKPLSIGFILLLGSAMASAQIYRWVDEDGRTHFSDRPGPSAEQIGPAGLVAADASPPNPAASVPAANSDLANPGPFEAFAITAPGAGEFLDQTNGDVAVSLLLAPRLPEDHQLELVIDGQRVPVADGTTQLQLTGLNFGSHKLRAVVRNADQAIVATTAVTDFHLRRVFPPGALP